MSSNEQANGRAVKLLGFVAALALAAFASMSIAEGYDVMPQEPDWAGDGDCHLQPIEPIGTAAGADDAAAAADAAPDDAAGTYAAAANAAGAAAAAD